jgi:ATP-dependent Clp protease ATP-binding subunit ClpA
VRDHDASRLEPHVYERFTEAALEALKGAQEEARALGHEHIGTEHLLLGLVRLQEGAAAQVLKSFSIDVDRTRALVAEEFGTGPGSPPGTIPFRSETRQALEAAQAAMLAWEHDHIDAEHILFGLLRALPVPTHRVVLGLHADPPTILAVLASEVAGQSRPRVFPHLEDPVQRRAREIALKYAGAKHPGRAPDSGDLLLGLAEVGQGAAALALKELGVSAPALRAAVERARDEIGPESGGGGRREPTAP